MKPFDRVLVRVTPEWEWMPHIFSKEVGDVYFTIDGRCWQYCIPFAGNEHLLGTTDSPTPPEPEPEFKFGDKVEVSDEQINWFPAIFYKIKAHCLAQFIAVRPTGIGTWTYCRKADW